MKLNALPPALILYTDNLPEDVGGRTNGFVIRIRPRYMNDEGIHRHELEHVKQNWRGLFIIHTLLYSFVRQYRLWAEVQAYHQQLRYQNRFGVYMTPDEAAERLASPHYDLGITIERVKAALT